MKIWVIGREYPSDFNKMRGSFEYEQAKMISKEHDVIYPCVDLRSVRHWRRWGISSFMDGKLKVYRYDFPVGKCPTKMLRSIEKRRFEILFDKVIDLEGKPDIIHVHYPAMAYYGSFIRLKEKGIKIVTTEHWTNVLKRNIASSYLESLKWFVDNADAFICVSNSLKDSVMELTSTHRKIDIVPNVVSPIFFDVVKTRRESHKFYFVASGRLVKVKQFDMLIMAFAKAFKGQKDVNLRIIGGGEEYMNLQMLVKELDMENQIQLTGSKKREDVAQLVKDSDVLVCSSRLETFGVPVIEGMACGKPVVVTDALGFNEPLNDTNSIIVHMDKEEEMTAALKKMFTEYKCYNAVEIKNAAFRFFGEDAVLQRLNDIYNNI